MLYRDISQNVNVVSGRALNRRGLSKGQKAALAAQIVLGEVGQPKLSRRQLVQLMHVSLPYIRQAERLPAILREGVRAGRYTLALASTVPTDKKLAETIKSAGIDRVWQALCKQL